MIEFVNTGGWRVIKEEYEKMIGGLNQYQLGLGLKAHKNADEIQATHDFMRATQLLLSITDNLIREHDEDNKTITRNQETAQGIAG